MVKSRWATLATSARPCSLNRDPYAVMLLFSSMKDWPPNHTKFTAPADPALVARPIARRVRLVGALVATSVILAVMGIVWSAIAMAAALNRPAAYLPDLGAGVIACGLPGAALWGWRLAPRTVDGRTLIGAIVPMAFLTCVSGAYAIALVLSLQNIEGFRVNLEGIAQTLFLSLGFALVGLVAYGLPALLVTVSCAYVWAHLVRAILREPDVVRPIIG